MWELEKRAHKISQEGRRKGRPFDETLRRILELYRASPIVASADLRGDVITIHYVGSRIRFMSQFSKDVMLEDPAPGYFERRSAKVRYESLLEMRRYLSSGSLIVHTGRAYTILPPQDSMEIDRIIQKMLAGAALGEEERVALDRDIPEFVMRVPSGPKRLRAVADCRD
jgi:hypothetical protein